MGADTKIAWADDTFNPWIGCMKISPGCDRCYAESLNKRWGKKNWGPGIPRRRTSPANWKKPIKWNKEAEAAGIRRKVFCASMADVFDNAVPDEWRSDLWQLIRGTPWLDWILLTKRIGNVKKMLPADWEEGYSNVWLCITIVNQDEAERDIQKLIAIPAMVRGLSIEPQLELIELNCQYCGTSSDAHSIDCPATNRALMVGIDWIITGAESGHGARLYNEEWTRSLRDQCQTAGIPFFYKQRIESGRKVETPELDGRIWTQFPGERHD